MVLEAFGANWILVSDMGKEKPVSELQIVLNTLCFEPVCTDSGCLNEPHNVTIR
jgi:hypothetical protein